MVNLTDYSLTGLVGVHRPFNVKKVAVSLAEYGTSNTNDGGKGAVFGVTDLHIISPKSRI